MTKACSVVLKNVDLLISLNRELSGVIHIKLVVLTSRIFDKTAMIIYLT